MPHRLPLLTTARVSTFPASSSTSTTCLSFTTTFRLQHRVYQTTQLYQSATPSVLRNFPCTFLALRPSHALIPHPTSTMARTKPTPPSQQQQTRTHMGHSHSHGGHSHSHDNSYLTSTNKNDAGVRITRIGLYVNLGMALSKGLGGYYFNSKALLADALHSLTDLVSDIMTLATVSWSLKPPSSRFPAGYGKIESLGSLGVSGILLASGCLMGWAAVVSLAQQFAPGVAEVLDTLGLSGLGHSHGHGGHGHDHGAAATTTDLGPNINAMWLAAGSIAIKEWLYRATLKVAKARKSSVLASNAYHHRVDSLTAFVALILIGASNVLSNAAWLDPVGGLVISLMIIQAGWGNTLDALFELADVGVESGVREKVRAQAGKALAEKYEGWIQTRGRLEVRNVQGVKAGQNYLMDVEVAVPGDWSVKDTRAAEEAVRTRVGAKVRGVKRVRVRFVAAEEVGEEGGDVADEFVARDVSPRSSPEPEDEQDGHAHKH